MNKLYLLRKRIVMKNYYKAKVIGLLSFLTLLVNGCATSGIEKPAKLIEVYKKERVICLPPQKPKNLKLNDIEYILGENKINHQNLIAVDGFNYEKLSDNDKAKYELTITYGLTALHYLNCINTHNDSIGE